MCIDLASDSPKLVTLSQSQQKKSHVPCMINKEKIILNKIIVHRLMEFRHTWKSSALTHYNKNLRALDLQPYVKAISGKRWTINHSFLWLTSRILMPNIAWSILFEQGLKVVKLSEFLNMWVNEKQRRFFVLIDGNVLPF